MLIPVILSGGAGTRLWPVSREAHPKPFMRIGGRKSLLLQTYRRAREASPECLPLVVMNRDYCLRSQNELSKQEVMPHYLLEPVARHTASAVAKPEHSLSLKTRHHSSKHWGAVSGTANITVGGTTVLKSPNQSTAIPIGDKHHLENPEIVNLAQIEVQCGSYLGEDGIMRFSDCYGCA